MFIEVIAWIATFFKKHENHKHSAFDETMTLTKNPIIKLVEEAIEEAKDDKPKKPIQEENKELANRIVDLQYQLKSYHDQLDALTWMMKNKNTNCDCPDASWRAYM